MLQNLLALALVSAVAGAQIQNTGLAVVPAPLGVAASGDLLAFAVYEPHQGTDLDGDGDLQSHVLHVRAGVQGAALNLHLPVPVFFFPPGNMPPWVMSERLVAFLVVENELSSGGTDLNGDGDKLDRVVHVWDRATQLVSNLGLAGVTLPSGLAVVGDALVMGVAELAQGQDLDGNGLLTSTVACTWTSPGILRISARPITVTTDASPSVAIASNRTYFREREGLSLVDRNGDGDMLDDVLQEMDLATGAITNLALDADDLVAGGPILAFRVGEANQGAQDLNGDGDTSDRVQHLRIASIGATRNLYLAIRLDQAGRSFTRIGGHLIALRQRESFIPPTDFNGDGDTTDNVLFVHDARANVTWNSQTSVLDDGHLTPRSFLVDGAFVMFSVAEFLEGITDLNGDGDMADRVVHVFSALSGTVTNLGLAGDNLGDEFRASAQCFTFQVGETQQGNVDLNGNGVIGESVLHVYDRASGTVQNLGVATTYGATVVLNRTNLLYTDQEFFLGDQNGDGDIIDLVLRHRDGTAGVVTNLALAVGAVSGQPVIVNAGGIGALSLSEPAMGADWNGDGDQADFVLVLARD